MVISSQFYFDLKRGRFVSPLWFDSVFPKKIRQEVAKFFDIIIILSLAAIIATFVFKFGLIKNIAIDYIFIREKAVNFFFFVLSFRLVLFSFESFYRSRSTVEIPKGSLNIADYLSFETASLLFKSFVRYKNISGSGFLRVFSETDIGKFSLTHLGIAAEDFNAMISRIPEEAGIRQVFPPFIQEISEDISSGTKDKIGLGDIVLAIFATEEKISKLFFELKIKKEDILGVMEWAEMSFEKLEKSSYWWQEENLARIPGIAKDWAYGATYLLDRFSRPFFEHHPVGEHQILHFTGHQKQIEAMEGILARSAQANVLIVGEPGVGKRTVVAGFGNMINQGRIRPELEYKFLIELDAPSLVATAKTKGDFENLIIRVFNDAVRAGNIILIIDGFSQFINSAANLGVSLIQILGPYLGGKDLQVIALDDSYAFKRFLEPDSSLMRYFELIRVEEPSREELIQILEDTSLELEAETGTIILYQTIQEAIKASNTYLTEGALPERAIDILETVSSRTSGGGRNVVLPEDISNLVSEKTKMPLGELKPEEREKLMRLEEILHRRVVDQEKAISAISAAVKRIRVGIQTTKKPLASFLFLGPTGVGKTETAKTLAEVYFGNEETITRFDMSEYQNEDGLERLIGSIEESMPGQLATRLRERPYGLLLLDEFEKCHFKVRDLFLQVLDEGFFTDAFGKKVFTRNNVIIATSNAASQLIWEMGKEGLDPSALKEAIIDAIQKESIFKPELLNRFDAIIIFRHLNREHLRAIALIMLEKLKKRLFEEKEMTLVINDILVEKVAEIGYDPLFGARPMQRAIQERIEKKIAEWIIGGKVERGAKIEFNEESLKNI